MIRCGNPAAPADRRYFPGAIYRTDDQPLAPGEAGVVVTIEVADDEAKAFLGPGQRITLWNGHEIGHPDRPEGSRSAHGQVTEEH